MIASRSQLALVAACLVAATGLAGCATSTGGTASPAPILHPTPTGARVPKVARPLDPTAMVSAPCTSLTMANVLSVGLTNPASQSDRTGNEAGCSWAGESGGGVSIAWEIANKHGLADLYTKQSTFAYWIPTTVSGYPAVYGDALTDLRSDGNCVLNVGVNDQLTFFIQYVNPLRPEQGCKSANVAAIDVIANLKAGM